MREYMMISHFVAHWVQMKNKTSDIGICSSSIEMLFESGIKVEQIAARQQERLFAGMKIFDIGLDLFSL